MFHFQYPDIIKGIVGANRITRFELELLNPILLAAD